MYRSDSDGFQAARAQLVSYSARLLDDGLAVGSAGNMSVRIGDRVAITRQVAARISSRRASQSTIFGMIILHMITGLFFCRTSV